MSAANNPYLFGNCNEYLVDETKKRYYPFGNKSHYLELIMHHCCGCKGCMTIDEYVVEYEMICSKVNGIKWYEDPKHIPPENFLTPAIKTLLKEINELEKNSRDASYFEKIKLYRKIENHWKTVLRILVDASDNIQKKLDRNTMLVINAELAYYNDRRWSYVGYAYERGGDGVPGSNAAPPYGDERTQIELYKMLFNIVSVCKFL